MQDAVAVFKCRLTHKSHRQCGTKHTRLNIKKQNEQRRERGNRRCTTERKKKVGGAGEKMVGMCHTLIAVTKKKKKKKKKQEEKETTHKNFSFTRARACEGRNEMGNEKWKGVRKKGRGSIKPQ